MQFLLQMLLTSITASSAHELLVVALNYIYFYVYCLCICVCVYVCIIYTHLLNLFQIGLT
jgi:hypothetical protein